MKHDFMIIAILVLVTSARSEKEEKDRNFIEELDEKLTSGVNYLNISIRYTILFVYDKFILGWNQAYSQ